MILTRDQFLRILPLARPRVDVFLGPLNAALDEWLIDTARRIAEFLPQVAHESAQFRYMRELGTGAAYDTGRLAERLGNTAEDDDDGERYKGRGPIQITGTRNYRNCSLALYGDERLLATPELLEQPLDGCRSAGWFWTVGAGLNLGPAAIRYGVQPGCNLNDLADRGDFEGITLAVNGGYNGIEDRRKYRTAAYAALGAGGTAVA